MGQSFEELYTLVYSVTIVAQHFLLVFDYNCNPSAICSPSIQISTQPLCKKIDMFGSRIELFSVLCVAICSLDMIL